MAQPLLAPMPDNLDLDSGYVLRITALSPTTGAVISGVKVSAAIIMGTDVVGTAPGELEVGDWVLVPGPE